MWVIHTHNNHFIVIFKIRNDEHGVEEDGKGGEYVCDFCHLVVDWDLVDVVYAKRGDCGAEEGGECCEEDKEKGKGAGEGMACGEAELAAHDGWVFGSEAVVMTMAGAMMMTTSVDIDRRKEKRNRREEAEEEEEEDQGEK